MNLSGPNDVKRPDKPNVDHIIEEIEKKFENEDFLEYNNYHVTIKISHYTNSEMMLVENLYREKGWRDFKYRYIDNPNFGYGTTINISFYF